MHSIPDVYPVKDRKVSAEDDIQYILRMINVSRKELAETIKLYRISAAAIAFYLKRISLTGSKNKKYIKQVRKRVALEALTSAF